MTPVGGPETPSTAGRFCAAVIAMTAMAGLAIQFDASYAQLQSLGATFWVMLRYFTIIANLSVLIVFAMIASGAAVSAVVLGGVTLAIILVGAVYAVLLRGLLELSGGAALADVLLHTATPLLVPLYWLALAPKGRLRWRDPLVFAAVPLVYFAYALARGAADGNYAYPFINVAELGWPRLLVNAVMIAAAFLAAGYAMVGLDHAMARRPA